MSEQIPQVEESTKFNFITSIWIVPFIAILIAGWLAYQYYAELGPEIRITFPKNEGLQAGQSYIKYKDVPIGQVKKVELEKDGSGVVVVARMDKTATPYLNESSRFWIVKPEVGISGVSGLDTLISGTYIAINAKRGKTLKTEFVGQDYMYRNLHSGSYFVLNSRKISSSVKKGTPIYFKNIKIGEVEYVSLSLDGKSVDLFVFIHNEYLEYVNRDSKFWVRSTLNVAYEEGTLDVNVAPVSDMIQGAIELSPSDTRNPKPVPDKFVFTLYKSKTAALSNRIGVGGKALKPFIIYTEDPIAKLKVNASVEYGGFSVGKVQKIILSYRKKTHKMKGEIALEIDTSVFKDPSDDNHTGEENFYEAVKEGLRAQIVSSDPITGSLYVDLTFTHNDEENRTIVKEGKYAVLPTVAASSGSVMEKVNQILDKINHLKLEKLLASVNKAVEATEEPIHNANDLLVDLKKSIADIHAMTDRKSFRTMPDEVDKALKELTRTLRTTRKVVKGYGSDSLLVQQISDTLRIVTKTSQEMQAFLKMLNRKPDALIFGDK
jgi:paraquat-inducible protein B